MVLTFVYTGNGCRCRIFIKVTAIELNEADDEGAGEGKGVKWLVACWWTLVLLAHNFLLLAPDKAWGKENVEWRKIYYCCAFCCASEGES